MCQRMDNFSDKIVKALSYQPSDAVEADVVKDKIEMMFLMFQINWNHWHHQDGLDS